MALLPAMAYAPCLINPAVHCDHFPLDHNSISFERKRFIGRVFRLQPPLTMALADTLYHGLIANACHHDITMPRYRLVTSNHVIPIQDAHPNHTVTSHLESEEIATPCLPFFYDEMACIISLGKNGKPCRDSA